MDEARLYAIEKMSCIREKAMCLADNSMFAIAGMRKLGFDDTANCMQTINYTLNSLECEVSEYINKLNEMEN